MSHVHHGPKATGKVRGWLATLAALVMLAVPTLADPQPAPPTDEFANPGTEPGLALNSIVRVNRHPLNTDVTQWNATADGVVVAPNVVVTLRSLTNGTTGEEDLRVLWQDGAQTVSFPATVDNAASDDQLVVLRVQGLDRAQPVTISDTPVASQAVVSAAGYSMELNESQDQPGVRTWTVRPALLAGHVTDIGDSLTHDMPTRYGYGGGALVDSCGRVVGILTETLEEQGEATHSAAPLARLRTLLTNARVTPQVRPGWCAPQDLVTRVRSARSQLNVADRRAQGQVRGALGDRLVPTILAGTGGLVGLVALGLLAMALMRSAPPRRKLGNALVWGGVGLFCAGMVLDNFSPQSQTVRLSCTFDAATSSPDALERTNQILDFDPGRGCRSGGGSNTHYAVGVAEPTSRSPVFIRVIRPNSASGEMGPGRPPIVETHAFSTDLTRYDVRRYALPPELYNRVQSVFVPDNNRQSCATADVAEASQARRRALVMAYVSTPDALTNHSSFTCTRR